MAGSQQDASSSSLFHDKMAGRRRAHDAIPSDEQFLDTVSSSNLRDQIDDFRVVETAVAANNEESIFGTFRDSLQDCSDEVLDVVGLLEDGNLFTKSRPSVFTVSIDLANWVYLEANSKRDNKRGWAIGI